MRVLILLVVVFHFASEIAALQYYQSTTFSFREYCTSQHFSSKYRVYCDGNKHFKDKVIFLDGRNVFRITDIELYSFDTVHIRSHTSSDWNTERNITIRNSKNVILKVESTFELNVLEIDSVEEFTFELQQPSSSVTIQTMVLSNIKRLNMNSSGNAEIKVNILRLNNIEDVNLFSQLQFSGETLTVSGSNIDVSEHSTMILKFPSIVVEDSSKLYIQKGGQSNISSDYFLIKESYIYMDGQMNISSYREGNKKDIKFLENSVYGMSRSHLYIFGNLNEIEFIENGIYSSDIGDFLDLVGEIEVVNFVNNKFGCDKCAKKLNIQTKYLQSFGKQNLCDFTCNVTLTRYKELLDQEKLCRQGKFSVDDKLLCSVTSEPTNTKNHSDFSWWYIILIVIAVSLLFSSILLYFYCKRHRPRFQSIPVESAVVLQAKMKHSQEDQNVIVEAFSDEVYEEVDNSPGNVYEIVDSPRPRR